MVGVRVGPVGVLVGVFVRVGVGVGVRVGVLVGGLVGVEEGVVAITLVDQLAELYAMLPSGLFPTTPTTFLIVPGWVATTVMVTVAGKAAIEHTTVIERSPGLVLGVHAAPLAD